MAEIAVPIAGELVACVGTAVLAPVIDRFKTGRQIARNKLAVYIPGEGRMIEFDSSDQNRTLYHRYLRREKWIVQYLSPSVINLAELASALSATRLLVVDQAALLAIENTVMVLGTNDPVRKLEGIMLAFKQGFLDAKVGQSSVPWKLLHDARYPAQSWQTDPKLLEIWYALHCEYIFPVTPSRVLAAADTLRRIRLETSGPAPLVTCQGDIVERHYEVPIERLLRIAESTDEKLLRGPILQSATAAMRVAGILGGARTLDLLGDDCAARITSALREVRMAHELGLDVKEKDGRYIIQATCSQARAEADFEAKGPREFVLSMHGMRKIAFTDCRTVDGSLVLEKGIAELAPGEVFEDVRNVEYVCQRGTHPH